MDTAVVATYCLTDDLLQAVGHDECSRRRVSDAEVITTALVAVRLFSGNFVSARAFLKSHGYIPKMLSKSQFNRRLHRAAPLLRLLFALLAEVHKKQTEEDVYLIDSFPIPACDNVRISRCRIYQGEAKEAFRGYIASKRRFFFGLKIHLLVSSEGRPVEVSLAPGSASDVRVMKRFDFELPDGSVVYGDKAYNDYDFEDLLAGAGEVKLLPLRKKNSKRAVPAFVRYLQHAYRKQVETTGSNIERRLPASIHAVTSEGFELKVFLFVLSISFDAFV